MLPQCETVYKLWFCVSDCVSDEHGPVPQCVLPQCDTVYKLWCCVSDCVSDEHGPVPQCVLPQGEEEGPDPGEQGRSRAQILCQL